MIVDLSVVTQFLNKIVFFFSLFRVIFPLCVCVCLDAHPLIQVKCVCWFVLSFLVSLKQNLSCKSHQTLFCLTQKILCPSHLIQNICVPPISPYIPTYGLQWLLLLFLSLFFFPILPSSLGLVGLCPGQIVIVLLSHC